MSNTAYNMAIEDAACKIDEIWRRYKDSIEAPGCTELCAAVRSLKRGIKEVEPVSLSTSEDWHFVAMSGKGPFDHQKEGWFPTEALAKSHKASFRVLDQQLMTIRPITEKERLSIIPVAPKYMQPHVSQMYEDYTEKYRDAVINKEPMTYVKFDKTNFEHKLPSHTLFVTGDADAPDAIKDSNGEVVLDLCKKCGRAEAELVEQRECDGKEPWPGGVTFQWYYVRLNNYGPNDARASGWFPTLELAHMHREAWPFTMQEHMVIIPEGNPNAPFNDKKAPEQMHGSTERALKKFMNDQAIDSMEIMEIADDAPDTTKWLFKEGMLVKKKSGSWWAGTIVGTYSTKQTPRGYCVQLATPGDNGPVQIYPEDALVHASPAELTNR